MSKPATQWNPYSARGETSSAPGGSLLLENGFNLLLEDGGNLLLEDGRYDPPAATQWTAETKQATSWYDDGNGEFDTDSSRTRVTAQGSTRVTAQGQTRITADGTVTPKAATAWSENDG